ncbi:MAG TPA: class IV adenylate cyclase [Burkholderiaceae bacterium]|jgi:adenylate cyclase|nr:class IV adenylate cyclase [Burkholderiaceae bacterium]
MARNIEIKARVADMDALRARAAALADSGPVEIPQDDTFFCCSSGRLKLRVYADGRGELIAYSRADDGGPKVSDYLLSPTASPDSLREALARSNGVEGRVVKHRTLFLVGRTRVHLDRVQGLGDFMELEVVLAEGDSVEGGVIEAHELMARLGIPRDALVEGAYHDLLRARAALLGVDGGGE